MAYCDIYDIYELGVNEGNTYTETTSPTLAQVESAIERISLEIDSFLYANGDVSTPIDRFVSPRAYELVRRLNAYGGAGEAESVAYRENSSRTTADVKKNEMYYKTEYERLLKRYSDDPKFLIDAVLGGRSPKGRTGEGFLNNTIRNNFDFSVMDNKGKYVKPFFTTDEEF